MKLKILLAAVFVAGVVTAFAVAAPPPGRGNPHLPAASTTGSTVTSTSATPTTEDRKVTLCHRTGHGTYHAIRVARAAVAAHLRHGDFVGTDCSKPATITTGTITTTASVATTNPA